MVPKVQLNGDYIFKLKAPHLVSVSKKCQEKVRDDLTLLKEQNQHFQNAITILIEDECDA